MVQISVTRQADGTFLVETQGNRAKTSHLVNVPEELPAALGCGHVPQEDLVRASFEFLLEREPATSILRRFSLDEISHYFPDYARAIRVRLGGDDRNAPQ